MRAVRNIRLCTKDCLCLYVCPTGATDTETGQIDASKCLNGCRACVDACPSHAISLVPYDYPPQQEKTDSVKNVMLALVKSKTEQERIAWGIANTTDNPVMKQFAETLSKSNRLMAEDLLRESGYMLPQSQNVQDFLKSLLEVQQPDDFPEDVVKRLLEIFNGNKTKIQEEIVASEKQSKSKTNKTDNKTRKQQSPIPQHTNFEQRKYDDVNFESYYEDI
jgi:ferredoxin